MTKDAQPNPDFDQEEYRAKRLAFYEACLNGWIQTTFEKDKAVLTISSGAIAIEFAVIFQSTGMIEPISLWIYLASGVAFVVSILFAVIIFSQNAKIFLAAIEEGREPSLRIYDMVLNFTFAAGMILLLVGAALQVTEISQKKALSVTEQKMSSRPQRGMAQDSVSGLQRLSPAALAAKQPAAKPSSAPAKPTNK